MENIADTVKADVYAQLMDKLVQLENTSGMIGWVAGKAVNALPYYDYGHVDDVYFVFHHHDLHKGMGIIP